ncbi:MAG: proprotein convertase P-domain-containing protein, partial [Rhodospirillales bacterium]
MAETWSDQSTASNLSSVAASRAPGAATVDNSTIYDSLSISSNLLVDFIEVDLNISHTWVGDLTVNLTSPDGTTSTLVNRPGVYAQSQWGTGQDDINFTFSSVQQWGEVGSGTWTLAVTDDYAADSGILNSWSLRLYGDIIDNDDTYIYTDEWDRHGGEAGRDTIVDATGTDTLNFAAITNDLTLDLMPGASSSLNFIPFTIDASTVIENVFGGDGDDAITGNDVNNTLEGMRGNDVLFGGLGDDTLTGGAGNDSLDGGAGSDTAIFRGNFADYTVTTNGTTITVVDNNAIEGNDGTDTVSGVETF